MALLAEFGVALVVCYMYTGRLSTSLILAIAFSAASSSAIYWAERNDTLVAEGQCYHAGEKPTWLRFVGVTTSVLSYPIFIDWISVNALHNAIKLGIYCVAIWAAVELHGRRLRRKISSHASLP